MIVRVNRSQSKFKTEDHRKMKDLIEQLQFQNKQLKIEVLRLEQRLADIQTSKKKYKSKYKDVKQQVKIMTLVGRARSRDDYNDYCASPNTKTTRIKNQLQQDQYNSITFPTTHSEFKDGIQHQKNFETEIDEYQTYNYIQSKKNITVPNFREIKENKTSQNEEQHIMKNLCLIHQELEKLSKQIDMKQKASEPIIAMETKLYSKLQQIVSKIDLIQTRQIERQKKRQEGKQIAIRKRMGSTIKTIEEIGKNIIEFKID